MPQDKSDQIIKRINDLPPLPSVVQKLLQVVGDNHSSAVDVTEVLSTDQALTAKILKLVNSSFYGFPRQISTLTRAVVILGNSAIRNLAISLASYNTLKKIKLTKDFSVFWEHSLACAVSAQALATHLKYPQPEEVFTAGLLHDLGSFILVLTFPEKYEQLLASRPMGLLEKEKEIFGLGHTEVGSILFDHWGFPENLSRVARFHHSPRLASAEKELILTLVMLADIISGIKGRWCGECADYSQFSTLSKIVQIPFNEYAGIFQKVEQRLSEAALLLGDDKKISKPGQVPELAQKDAGKFALLAADENCAAWFDGLLRHFGYEVALIAAPAMETTDYSTYQLVLIATPGLEPGLLQRLVLRLMGKQIPVAYLAGEDESQLAKLAALPAAAVLPMIFSSASINSLLKGIPV